MTQQNNWKRLKGTTFQKRPVAGRCSRSTLSTETSSRVSCVPSHPQEPWAYLTLTACLHANSLSFISLHPQCLLISSRKPSTPMSDDHELWSGISCLKRDELSAPRATAAPSALTGTRSTAQDERGVNDKPSAVLFWHQAVIVTRALPGFDTPPYLLPTVAHLFWKKWNRKMVLP